MNRSVVWRRLRLRSLLALRHVSAAKLPTTADPLEADLLAPGRAFWREELKLIGNSLGSFRTPAGGRTLFTAGLNVKLIVVQSFYCCSVVTVQQ